jgi:Uma2 family endonuclease
MSSRATRIGPGDLGRTLDCAAAVSGVAQGSVAGRLDGTTCRRGATRDTRVTLTTYLFPMSKPATYVPEMTQHSSLPATMTADELLRLQPPDKRVELVRGVMVVREPPGFRHGVVAFAIAARIGAFVHAHGLGVVVAAETGFKLFSDPDTVRAPDVGFIQRDRVPDPLPRGYGALAPDLVVEVLSPDDRPGEVLQKTGDWLSAGTRLVWVIDSERRTARVYRADGSLGSLTADDVLEGEDVLPGFSCRLAEIL